MNVERAFQRRAALQERLARIERTGQATWGTKDAAGSRYTCAESASGSHDTDRNGKCHWCGMKVDSAVPVSFRYEPTIDIQDVIDPLTLEPVDPHDRDGYKPPGRQWDSMPRFMSPRSCLNPQT